MHTIGIAINVAFAALAAYIAVTVYLQYRKETSLSGWARWRATAMDSATMLWGKFSLFIAGVVANLDLVFNALGLDSVTNFINQWVNPKSAAAVIAIIAVGSMLTRMRTLTKPS